MFKRSCEDPTTLYLCLPFGFRFVFREGHYMGWYKA